MRSIPLAVLALPSLLAAQIPETVPPGFTSIEAPGDTYVFGGYANLRGQIGFAFFRGKKTRISEIQFRPGLR